MPIFGPHWELGPKKEEHAINDVKRLKRLPDLALDNCRDFCLWLICTDRRESLQNLHMVVFQETLRKDSPNFFISIIPYRVFLVPCPRGLYVWVDRVGGWVFI